ncbi:MAG: LysR substrate-binding domain-containing protein [Planctomycetota bacterium]|nr:LysR substrate-binding domain-containing protein [Planctomycetota bacterium]
MIDLHRLAGFHLVATAGGYARATRAAAYPITQPALHQQVRKLEAEIGLTLLERLGKDQMVPPAAGAHLLEFIRPFFRDLPATVRRIQTGAFDGELSIQAESLLIRQLLPDWLLALRKQRPDVQLRLQEIAQPDLDALRTGRTDVMIAYLPDIPDDIAAQTVATLHPYVVLPRELAGSRKSSPRLNSLADTPFLSYPPGSRRHTLQMQVLAQHHTAPTRTISADTADSILGFVESGLGWSLLPSLDRKGPPGRRLAAFPLERPKLSFPISLAWRKDAAENPMLDALIRCAPKA